MVELNNNEGNNNMKITVNGIAKNYKGNTVLRGASFEAGSGQIIGITGGNGCGKTTLLSILVGLIKPDAGEVYVDGKRVDAFNTSWSKAYGYVPQINPLPGGVTVRDCLRLWCDDRQVFDMICSKYELTDFLDRRIEKLSGGMKRRTSIACAMATMPQVLIMDEPTAALDITYKQLIHKDMREFAAAGGILIMVTHEADEIAMCNACYRMENGVLNKYEPTV